MPSLSEPRQRTWRQNLRPPNHHYRCTSFLDQLICMLVPSFPLPTRQGRDPVRHPRDRISPHPPPSKSTPTINRHCPLLEEGGT